jgi:hypothetical protein
MLIGALELRRCAGHSILRAEITVRAGEAHGNRDAHISVPRCVGPPQAPRMLNPHVPRQLQRDCGGCEFRWKVTNGAKTGQEANCAGWRAQDARAQSAGCWRGAKTSVAHLGVARMRAEPTAIPQLSGIYKGCASPQLDTLHWRGDAEFQSPVSWTGAQVTFWTREKAITAGPFGATCDLADTAARGSRPWP